MWQHRISSMCLPENIKKMLDENQPFINIVKLSNQFTLYEINHDFMNDVPFPNESTIIIVIQENQMPYQCQYHSFTYKNAEFQVCESISFIQKLGAASLNVNIFPYKLI